MATNNRISDLSEVHSLTSFDLSFVQPEFNPNIGNQDDDVLFLVASSGQKNEKIKFKNLKKSILDSSVLLSGNQNIYGSKTFFDDCSFEGAVAVGSYTIKDYIYHQDDIDTNIQFDTGIINFSANDSININVSGNSVNINNSGAIAINTNDHSGALTVNGDGYFNNLYILNDINQFVKISPFPEDSVHFSLPLVSGVAEYNIDFPKTFQEPPSVSREIQGSVQEGSPLTIPYLITNVTDHNYRVNFASPIPNDSYQIHTLAKPTGDSSFRKTKTVSLVEDLASGQSLFEISFPEPFDVPPILSTTLQSDNYIVPYLITETSAESFKILFSSQLPEDAKLHVHATR